MKIAKIETHVLSIPEDEPLANAPERDNAMRPVIAVTIRTDDGTDGIGLTFYGGALTKALDRAVQDLGALIIGDDPLRTEAIAAKLNAAPRAANPAASSPWRSRRSTSRYGISRAKRSASRSGSCSAGCETRCPDTHPVRCGAV